MKIYYDNDDDRAYGLAGMCIGMAALDAVERIALVDLDADGPMVSIAGEYLYDLSGHCSPKEVWSAMLHNFYLTASMSLANVLSRSMIRLQAGLPTDILTTIHEAVIAEGKESCQLEEDEAEALYNRSLTTMRRVFANPRLREPVRELAGTLSRARRLSGGDIADELRRLGIR